jgi:pimeloyl-ACP methyl ester carboxylesterase
MKPILLCLHGWGGSKESFTELRAAIATQHLDIEVLTPDLPGFGDEAEPREPWTVEKYAQWVAGWMKDRFTEQELKDHKLMILGHSHGGRIAIWITSHQMLPVSHLYLCASAGIKHARHIKRIIGLTLAKSGKALLKIPGLNLLQPLGKKFLYRLVRVHDYEKASPLMQQTMILVTKEDLSPLLPKIHVPTNIFWGEDDGMTPVSDAYAMHKAIKHSHLKVFPGVRHAIHRDKAPEIVEVIGKNLKY